DSGSVHASTEAWIDSVENARSEDWRESAITATNSVDQHPHIVAEEVKNGSQNEHHSSPRNVDLPRLKKVASGVSLSALRPSSTTPPVSANTTTTMNSESMSSAATHNYVTSKFRPESRGGITTDNDDDDFQSAYSTSPRMNGGSASELERGGSIYGNSGRRSRQQYIPVSEPNRLSLGRAPSFTSTTLSTGAVGGLGLTGTDYDSRSRASSIGTYLEASAADKGRSPSHSGSDHTVGNPEPASDSPKTRSSHPPVSMSNRAGPNSTSAFMPRKGSFTAPSTNLNG
ncbi:9749_t:CDS:1, partial [Acaulospora colombiana]